MSSGSDDRSPDPIASRRAAAAAIAAAAADRPRRRRRAKRDRSRRSPASYLSLRDRDRERDRGRERERERDRGRDEVVGRRSLSRSRSRSRSPGQRRGRRYFDVERRRSRSRSPPSPVRRRRARWGGGWDSDGDEEEPHRRGRSRSRSRSPGRFPAPRSCRSRSRTRSEECENRACCRRSRSPARNDDGDGERSVSRTPPPEEDFYLRIDRSDDLFKCARCFELLSSPVYECVDGHVTCAVCHARTNEGNGDANGDDDRCSRCDTTEYMRSRAVAGWLKSLLFPCGNHEHGCPAFLPRHEAEPHERSCRYAPVFCPVDWRCDFPGGPTDALERHVTAAHGWAVVGVRYGEPVHVRVRPGAQRTLLRAEEDGGAVALFYLCARAADGGDASVLSMIRIRPDDDDGAPAPPAAARAAQYTYEVKTPPEAPGMQHRFQMQSTVWGTSLRDGVLYANTVDVKVPGSMLPREGPHQDSVEVRIVKAAPAGDSVVRN